MYFDEVRLRHQTSLFALPQRRAKLLMWFTKPNWIVDTSAHKRMMVLDKSPLSTEPAPYGVLAAETHG